jgi:hypothetical protein
LFSLKFHFKSKNEFSFGFIQINKKNLNKKKETKKKETKKKKQKKNEKRIFFQK